MKNTIKYNGKLNAIGSTIKEYRIKIIWLKKICLKKLNWYGIDLNKNSLQKLKEEIEL